MRRDNATSFSRSVGFKCLLNRFLHTEIHQRSICYSGMNSLRVCTDQHQESCNQQQKNTLWHFAPLWNPSWPRRKDHFRQETAHFSHQGLLQFLQNEATGEHHLKSKGHKTEIIGDDTSDTLCTANPVSVQMRCSLSIRSLGCNTHETLYLHGEAGGMRNWWGVVHWDPTGEHKLDTEAAQRMGRLKAAFPYNAGGESRKSLNKGQSPAIR